MECISTFVRIKAMLMNRFDETGLDSNSETFCWKIFHNQSNGLPENEAYLSWKLEEFLMISSINVQ